MLNILFPKICNACKAPLLKAERVICAKCIHNLPLACYHRTNNPAMKQIFYGRFPVEQATAVIQFQKRGITQEILHNLKYRGQKEISSFFGAWLGAEISKIEAYSKIEMVIPVPLHKQRLRKRGYNQVSGFGKEIAKALQVPFREDILLKVSKTNSQVFKKRLTRFDKDQVFTVKDPVQIKNQHLLLVDDIVTTGATLEQCAQQLGAGTNITLSVATIAIA